MKSSNTTPKRKRSLGTNLRDRWWHMLSRCQNPRDRDYPNYGGRNISVCDEWKDFNAFEEWAEDTDWSPELTLDRVDNDGDYEPGNCRWATRKEQAENRRSNHREVWGGVELTLTEWTRTSICVVNSNTLGDRLQRGWKFPVALTTPAKSKSYKAGRKQR